IQPGHPRSQILIHRHNEKGYPATSRSAAGVLRSHSDVAVKLPLDGTVAKVESQRLNECPLHGTGVRPEYLVGRRLERVMASWHSQGAKDPSGPLDVWLIDSDGDSTRVTTGSDWCLVVEASAPFEGYDMAECGRVEVASVVSETPFAEHIGETVTAVREEEETATGRIALEVTFDSGGVRCESWSGELRLSAT
ncbi:hypothetical protein AB0H00_28565, partial [Nocardia sp. NPDC023852]|uniref:hypothetical protein n=1 Tax=Nocardia sp. NPDC023852 TaxID=3154697 RepID=UPI0033E416CE